MKKLWCCAIAETRTRMVMRSMLMTAAISAGIAREETLDSPSRRPSMLIYSTEANAQRKHFSSGSKPYPFPVGRGAISARMDKAQRASPFRFVG